MESATDFPTLEIVFSADGLDALASVLSGQPAGTGAAWLLTQHAAPGAPITAPDHLARMTGMPAVWADHDMPVQPGTLYVALPGTMPRVTGGRLRLDAPDETGEGSARSYALAQARSERRENQQRAVAELGRRALSGDTLCDVFGLAVRELSRLLHVRYAKVLQLNRDGKRLTLRAGIGWDHATVGQTTVDAGRVSQAGYTLEQRKAVVVRDFSTEDRFTAPPILTDNGIQCGASVVIGPPNAPWGVLGVHERDPSLCRFDCDDINFLQTVAHVLWLVIARDQTVARIDAERSQLRDLTDNLPFLFAVVDDQQRYEMLNSAYNSLGRPVSEIEGKRVSDLLDPASYARVAPRIAAVLTGERQQFEIAFRAFEQQKPTTGLVTYVPRRAPDGRVTGYYSAILDISEKKRLERALAERFDQYRALGESISFGVWITDPVGNLTYLSQSFLDLTGKSFDELSGTGWLFCLAGGTQEETSIKWAETVKAGTNWEHEHQVTGADGKTYHILALGRPIRDEDGQITSWVGLNLDITERKAEADRLAVISAELDHRVKNVLATVSTIARMTGRTATDLDEYRDSLQARLRAMAAAHKLLSDAGWQGMTLARLVETEIGPYRAAPEGSVSVRGPDVVLTPALVQTLALAFHEMTTNSVKYGALSREGGRLEITWSRDPDLRIDWIESGLTGVTPPETEGFGTTLLTRVLAAQGADVKMEFPDSGLRIAIKLPDPES